MKTILITGVDGCGKSTIFERLKHKKLSQLALLNAPHFDEEALAADEQLLLYARAINQMSYEADKNEQSVMKALALFCSMLLFHRVANVMISPTTKMLLCERHPLIDARVYAAFYAQKSGTVSISETRMIAIEKKYEKVFAFIGSLLPPFKGSVVKEIFYIIETYFGKEQASLKKLGKLFRVSLPHQVYYLNAPAEILQQRITLRKNVEPHETLPILRLLQQQYSTVLTELPAQVKVAEIDASSFMELDAFYQQLFNQIVQL